MTNKKENERLLKLIAEAEDLLSQTASFKEWRLTHTLDEITPEVYDKSFFNADYESWREALALYDLLNWRANIDTISKDQAYYLTLRNFIKKIKNKKDETTTEAREEIKEAVLPLYYKTARGITSESTRGRKKGRTLYDLFDDEETKEEIRRQEADGKLLSTLTSGIVVSATENKVIKAIQKHISAQGLGYGRPEGGLPEDVVKQRGVSFDSEFTYVCLQPYKLTEEVLGTTSIGGENVKRVTESLKSLDGKFYYDETDGAFYRLLTIEKITPARDKEAGEIWIACRKRFTEGLDKNFINTRTDELQLLSGINSDMSLRLYDILKEMENLGVPTVRKSQVFHLNKQKLFERIAVKKSYDKNPKRAEEDFKSAVEDNKKIGIILRAVERGSNIDFYFNPNWKKNTSEGVEIGVSQELKK